jgi:hypothetical protein
MKNLVKYKKCLDETTHKMTKKATMPGRPSQLEHLRDELLPWLRNLREKGVKVRVRRVAIQVKRLDKTFRRTKRYTLFATVRRFMNSNGFPTRTVTHKAQGTQDDTQVATNFLASTCPLLHQRNRDKRFIINMDQTPFNPKEGDNRTLAERGSKTVAGKEVNTNVGRVTCMLTVCADGTKLPPMIIFKGQPGKAVAKETCHFTKDCKYVCQKNAWTDEAVMLEWVEVVLKPYVKTCPRGIIPYLLLDKYGCHYQGTVAQRIEELGVEWDIIPGGCTGLIQPIDVGIGKPTKCRLRNRMEDYLIDKDDGSLVTPKEMRKMISEFVAQSWNEIPKEVVYNAWRHEPFSYFPTEPSLATTFVEHMDYDDTSSDEEEEDANQTAV